MFYLIKILIYIIIPPGFFILLMFLLLCILKHKKASRYLLTALILMFYFMSIQPVASILFKGLEKDFFKSDFSLVKNEKYIVTVLGAGSNNRADTDRFSGLPSEAVKRLISGWRIAEKYGFSILLSGGNVYKRSDRIKNEVSLMKEFLKNLDFPEDRIILEDKSRNTRENARYSCEILKKMKIRKTVLVTSAYHMKRAKRCFEQNGADVVVFPVDFRSRDGKSYIFFDFLPEMSSLNDSTRALREYYANLYYFW
jgi:uncharacterized SAM-binding protein YcdF (DUF218 family)